MRGRGTLVVLLATAVLLVGCSSDEGAAPTKAKIPNKPAGVTGDTFCGKVSKQLIDAAIGAPYRTFDPQLPKDFPVPGVAGYECKWQWENPDGDLRELKVDALSFKGALEGSLDAAWKGTVTTLGARGDKVDGVGDEAYSAKLQGLVTLTARQGDWQVTTVSSAQGAASPASVDSLALVTATVLEATKG